MADQGHIVPETRELAGREILALTDQFGFDAYAAAWVYDRPTDKWKYLLVTPMLSTHGPRWVYGRLLKLFRRHPLPEGISPLDIFAIDPTTEIAIFGEPTMTANVTNPNGPPGLRITVSHDLRFDGFAVEDGFVAFLRRLSLAERKKRRNPAVVFNHRISRLEVAA